MAGACRRSHSQEESHLSPPPLQNRAFRRVGGQCGRSGVHIQNQNRLSGIVRLLEDIEIRNIVMGVWDLVKMV